MEDYASLKLYRIVLDMNKSGMYYLSHCTNPPYGRALLKKAYKLLNEYLKVREKDLSVNKLYGITLNNLGCYYKKTNKPKVALSYLKKALAIEVYYVEDWVATAGTHLNICAIFSYLKKHREAADHAALSIRLLERYRKIPEKNIPVLQNMLMISYYNQGVELYHLKLYNYSCYAYKKGLALSKLTKKGEEMSKVFDYSIARTNELYETTYRRINFMIEKKRYQYEKGFYEFMRKNKKHYIIRYREEHDSVGRYAEYSQPRIKILSSTEALTKGKSEVRIRKKPNYQKNQNSSATQHESEIEASQVKY